MNKESGTRELYLTLTEPVVCDMYWGLGFIASMKQIIPATKCPKCDCTGSFDTRDMKLPRLQEVQGETDLLKK